MQITKCDKCKRIKPKHVLSYDPGSQWVNGSCRGLEVSYSFDLCDSCGKSLVEYMKKFFGIKKE